MFDPNYDREGYISPTLEEVITAFKSGRGFSFESSGWEEKELVFTSFWQSSNWVAAVVNAGLVEVAKPGETPPPECRGRIRQTSYDASNSVVHYPHDIGVVVIERGCNPVGSDEFLDERRYDNVRFHPA